MALKTEYDCKINIAIVGDSFVGKTCLSNRFINNTFSYEPLGSHISWHHIDLDGKSIKLSIWETISAVRGRYSYLPKQAVLHGVMLVYDVSAISSFWDLENFIAKHCFEGTKMILIGNKCDSENRREVSPKNAIKFANEHDMQFLETSAQTGLNVEEAFLTLARSIQSQMKIDERLVCKENEKIDEMRLDCTKKKEKQESVFNKWQRLVFRRPEKEPAADIAVKYIKNQRGSSIQFIEPQE